MTSSSDKGLAVLPGVSAYSRHTQKNRNAYDQPRRRHPQIPGGGLESHIDRAMNEPMKVDRFRIYSGRRSVVTVTIKTI